MHFLKLLTVIIFVCITAFAHAGDNKIPYGNNAEVGKYATINGIKIYYEIYGKGRPVVLIHGNGDSIAGMAAQIAYFSKTRQVIVADSRGHGKSGLGTDQLTYMQMMEDWNSLLEQLKVSKAHIFGWSDGGILGLLMAIHHPERIGKMALMGANLRPDDTAVKAWVKPILQDAQQQIAQMITKGDDSNNWPLQKQLVNLLMTQPDIAVKDVQNITAPVLVMAGDRDVIKEEHTIEIFQNLPNAHLAILPGNTHFAPIATPDIFNGLLRNFFDKPFTKPSTKEIMEQH